jgi:large subunit ribosomal protein L10
MNRTQKEEIIEQLKGELSLEGGSVILAEFKGLTVEKADAVRREFRAADCSYRVVKNTLLERAVLGTPLEELKSLLQGNTAIAYNRTDPVAPAKAAVKCAKDHDKFSIKGGFFEAVLDAVSVEQLSKMPSKDELRSKLLATMLAVPQNLLRLMLAAPQRMLLVLESRKRQLEQG